jgi:hypothetical protein
MQTPSLKIKMAGLLVSVGLFAGGLLVAPYTQNALQSPGDVDLQATLSAFENRIAGLESRVSELEAQSSETAEPSMAPTTPPTATHTLTGSLTITLATGKYFAEGEGCSGNSAIDQPEDLSGFRTGTRITISDASGKVVATGAFSQGTTSYSGSGQSIKTLCIFTFEVPNIPDSDFYNIAIDGFEGSVNLSKQELEERNWTLTLG